MKISEKFRLAVALMACAGMMSPVAAFGATPTDAPVRESVSVQDTKLVEGDTLVGKAVDAQGNPLAGTTVTVQGAGQQPVQVATNDNGEFHVAGLAGGVYQISTMSATAQYRVWTSQAAPPAATEGVLLVDYNAMVTRGQCASGGCANSAPAYGGGGGEVIYGGGAPAYGGGEVVYGNGGGGGEVIYGDGGCNGGGGAGYVGDGGGYGYAGDCGPTGYGGGGGRGGFLGFLSSPWVIGAGVAAAIAIPLALDDDDDDNGNGNGAGNNGGGASS